MVERDVDSTARRPTMGDIAAYLGVSRQLVSAVLRDAPGASAQNRDRVQRAVRELGYAPHVGAQLLRRSRSRHLGVLFTLAHSFDLDLVDNLYSGARDRGYDLVLSAMTETRDERRAVRELQGFRTAGIILLGPDSMPRGLLEAAQVEPIVLFGRTSGLPDVDSVRSDDTAGIESVVGHLIGLGHRDIVHVDGGDLPGARDRRASYERTMRRHRLAGHIRVLPGDYTEESGAAAALTLLAGDRLPTAVVAANDRCAVGLIEMLHRHGCAVPDTVSITGFDDSRLARTSYRSLTTVRQDAQKLSAAALDTVIERIEGRRSTHKDVVLATALVVRETSGPVRAQAAGPGGIHRSRPTAVSTAAATSSSAG